MWSTTTDRVSSYSDVDTPPSVVPVAAALWYLCSQVMQTGEWGEQTADVSLLCGLRGLLSFGEVYLIHIGSCHFDISEAL